MSDTKKQALASEEQAMEVAEASREQWKNPSFLKEMFMGKLRMDIVDPFPAKKGMDTEEYRTFYEQMRKFLTDEVDSDLIDREGKIPEKVINRLREMRAFALKIDKKYGGHGFTQAEYNEILKLVATQDANLVALLSAHQSIGVPQPLIMFGTEEQKEKYLTRIAKGEISAFALTEPHVGSDPANLKTVVKDDGEGGYVLNGEKLWCTNGTIADQLVVMARHEEDNKISAFIVETGWEGVKVEHRCHFMGLKAIENGYLSFKNVKVPGENLIWERGSGLKLALITLNTGRLSIPGAVAQGARKALEIAREWTTARFQWGQDIYKHEAMAEKIADTAAAAFGMEAVSDLATALYDQKQDIRLEAAVAKLYNTELGWVVLDELLQMRGGRGYETADSLKARGESHVPVERMMRDFRINRIFEGTTEIMHLFIAREAVDKHLQVAGVMIDKKSSIMDKLKALPGIGAFYAKWYSKLWLDWSCWPRFSEYGEMAGHMRFIHRNTRKMARNIFHGMVFHGPKLQQRQLFLFRIVDIACELYAMAATISLARKYQREGNHQAMKMADVFCQNARRKVKQSFSALWCNSDSSKYALSREICEKQHLWLEEGIIPMTQDQKDKMSPELKYQD